MLSLASDQEEAFSPEVELVLASPPNSEQHQWSETGCKNLPVGTAFGLGPPCTAWLYHR